MNKKAKQTIVILGMAAIALSGCSTYKLNYKDPSASAGVKHSVKQSFFLWGHFGGDDIDLKQLCPSGVSNISSESSFVDALLFGLTGGLYSPRSVEVQCQSGTAYRVDETEEGIAVNELAANDA